jgi:hypothetical protein
LEALEGRECPSTLKVTDLGDLGGAKGTLRYEIAHAQSNDTIVFASKLNGGTISLNSGEELFIGKNLTIQGPGAGLLTISSDPFSHTVRIFEVGNGAKVTLSGLTVSSGGGVASFSSGNYFDGYGGDILNFGTLTINGCKLTGGNAYYGGAIYNGNGDTLTLSGCTLSGNSASYYYGGGLYNAGNANVQNSTLSGNTAFEGGGIYNAASATLSLSGSALSDNRASYGGGIYTIGTATVSGCTLSGNTASLGGAGIYNGGTQMELTVLNSIFSNQTDNIFGPYTDGGGNSFQ